MYPGNMVDEAHRAVGQPTREPMAKRLERVLISASSWSGRRRAEALASAGVIKDTEIAKVARRLENGG